jgi:hypothetical protein
VSVSAAGDKINAAAYSELPRIPSTYLSF